MKWRKQDDCTTVVQVIERNTGLKIRDILNPSIPDQTMFDPAIEMIQIYALNDLPINIIGDYDCDGERSVEELTIALRAIGVEPNRIIPRRFSNGYGLSVKIIDEMIASRTEDDELIICVDNGIRANEAITKAKENGYSVIIIDHHKRGSELPPADIIIDPSMDGPKNEADYTAYCGAGLVLRLALRMATFDEVTENSLWAMAAIATVADVVPLRNDNLNILRKGLNILNNKPLIPGLTKLAQYGGYGTSNITETTIGFKLAPMCNAPGRLLDDGASLVVEAVLATDEEELEERFDYINTLNERRKQLVYDSMREVNRIINDEGLKSMAPIVVYSPDFHEGIVGILAGKIAENYNVPALVLTNSKNPGEIKGSGRTAGGVDIYELVNSAKEILVKFGGHPGACGLSLQKENLEKLRALLYNKLLEYSIDSPDEKTYDLECTIEEVPDFIKEVKKYGPYGESNPAPIFRVNGFVASPRGSSHYAVSGSNKEHVKIYGKEVDACAFWKHDEYVSYGCPMKFDCICTLTENRYMDYHSLQLEVIDFIVPEKKKSKLEELLEAKLKEKLGA